MFHGIVYNVCSEDSVLLFLSLGCPALPSVYIQAIPLHDTRFNLREQHIRRPSNNAMLLTGHYPKQTRVWP
jgi:hypothetical protein